MPHHTRKTTKNKRTKNMRNSQAKTRRRQFILRKGMIGNPNVAGYSAISRLYSSVYGHRRPAALFY
jgi:hypothetical protein